MQYLDPSLRQANLYRYVPLHRLLEVLSLNKLTFMKTSKWEDPFEGFLFDYCVREFPQWHLFSGLKTSLFCLCLSTDTEKDQIWRAYTPNSDGVRMKLNLSALEPFLGPDYILGNVCYRVVSTIKKLLREYRDEQAPCEDKLLKLFFFKRKAFKSDQEVRMITTDASATGDVKSVEIDARAVIGEIMFDPRMDGKLYSSYKDLLKSDAYRFPGKIHQSELYSPAKVFTGI